MDSVSIAFELMMFELHAEEETLNSKGSASFYQSNYDVVQSFADRGKLLLLFRQRIEALAEEWQQKFAADFPDEVSPNKLEEARRNILSGSKLQKTGLVVRFPDGSAICELKASETFAKTIQRIGFEQVASLNLTVNKEPLVSKSKSLNYSDTEINGYFIKTHSNTKTKKRTLDDVSEALNCGLTVNIL